MAWKLLVVQELGQCENKGLGGYDTFISELVLVPSDNRPTKIIVNKKYS